MWPSSSTNDGTIESIITLEDSDGFRGHGPNLRGVCSELVLPNVRRCTGGKHTSGCCCPGHVSQQHAEGRHTSTCAQEGTRNHLQEAGHLDWPVAPARTWRGTWRDGAGAQQHNTAGAAAAAAAPSARARRRRAAAPQTAQAAQHEAAGEARDQLINN